MERKDRADRVQCWARFGANSCCNVGGDTSRLTSPLYTVAARDLKPEGDASICACMSGIQQVWKTSPSSRNHERFLT